MACGRPGGRASAPPRWRIAHAERALPCSCDHEDPRVRVGCERVDRFGDAERHLDVDGVRGVLSIERELRDVSKMFNDYGHL
jgi:hypothetical protein